MNKTTEQMQQERHDLYMELTRERQAMEMDAMTFRKELEVLNLRAKSKIEALKIAVELPEPMSTDEVIVASEKLLDYIVAFDDGHSGMMETINNLQERITQNVEQTDEMLNEDEGEVDGQD